MGSVGVGKCVTKENPKSDLDLDLGFVKRSIFSFTRYDFTLQIGESAPPASHLCEFISKLH